VHVGKPLMSVISSSIITTVLRQSLILTRSGRCSR